MVLPYERYLYGVEDTLSQSTIVWIIICSTVLLCCMIIAISSYVIYTKRLEHDFKKFVLEKEKEGLERCSCFTNLDLQSLSGIELEGSEDRKVKRKAQRPDMDSECGKEMEDWEETGMEDFRGKIKC